MRSNPPTRPLLGTRTSSKMRYGGRSCSRGTLTGKANSVRTQSPRFNFCPRISSIRSLEEGHNDRARAWRRGDARAHERMWVKKDDTAYLKEGQERRGKEVLHWWSKCGPGATAHLSATSTSCTPASRQSGRKSSAMSWVHSTETITMALPATAA